jgi:hypothetical protein
VRSSSETRKMNKRFIKIGLAPLQRCCRVAVYALFCNWCSAVAASLIGEVHTPMSEFESFVASPPVIDAVVFRTIKPADALKLSPLDGGGHHSADSIMYYYGRWEPECLFLKSGKNSDVARDGRGPREEIYSRFHDEFWKLSPPGFLTTWIDSTKQRRDLRMRPSHLYDYRTIPMREMLNMGIMHIDFGTVRWRNDKFTAEGYIPEIKSVVEINGQLYPAKDGYPKEMEVRYGCTTGVYNYVYDYSYGSNVGLIYLPSEIQAFLILDGKKIKLSECDILSIKSGQSVLPRSEFDLRAPKVSSGMPSIIYTNGGYYAKNMIGEWSAIRTPDGQVAGFTKGNVPLVSNGAYFAAIGISILMAFSYVWRIRKRTSKNW